MYNKTHSITFGDGTVVNGRFVGTNTWKDWHLIPSSRPDVTAPSVETNMIHIPGRHGSIDMSEYLTGGPVYGDSSGTWNFLVDNDHERWEAIRTKIMNFLHGKRMKCVLEDDPAWYYEGRFQVKPASGERNSTISIDYVLYPYKKYILDDGRWLWDPFNFTTDRTDQRNDRL